MWYVILLLTFAIALFLMVFAKDGYMNMELTAYQKTIVEPWIHRVVALKYAG
nr:TPA: gp58-like protein [Oryctes rhinoceros nudivirus]